MLCAVALAGVGLIAHAWSWPGAVWLGVTGVSGGLLVFMLLVADRLFPSASRVLVLMLEALTFAVFLAGVALTVFRLTEGIRQ